jgi:hypothetical protein
MDATLWTKPAIRVAAAGLGAAVAGPLGGALGGWLGGAIGASAADLVEKVRSPKIRSFPGTLPPNFNLHNIAGFVLFCHDCSLDTPHKQH